MSYKLEASEACSNAPGSGPSSWRCAATAAICRTESRSYLADLTTQTAKTMHYRTRWKIVKHYTENAVFDWSWKEPMLHVVWYKYRLQCIYIYLYTQTFIIYIIYKYIHISFFTDIHSVSIAASRLAAHLEFTGRCTDSAFSSHSNWRYREIKATNTVLLTQANWIELTWGNLYRHLWKCKIKEAINHWQHRCHQWSKL